MRIVPAIVCAVTAIILVLALSFKWGAVPPMGKFLSPQHGFWQNAESITGSYDAELKIPGLRGQTEVYFDERLVPHIFSDNDADAYFVQGYLHAKFRLWQMEFQTMATAGRISEIIGDKAINYDREQRRMGLTYAAENMVKEMEADEHTHSIMESYTAGVNAYIENMKESELPVEYKLLDYVPEKWSTLKTALFIKQLTKTLAGYNYANDFQFTNLHSIFSEEQMKILFPFAPDSLSPIIPRGTVFPDASVSVAPPADVDSLYFHSSDSVSIVQTDKPTKGIGSNNWAVNGSKTASGFPILCNDPHLDLTVPSIWYEQQLNTPTMNAYGTSFPGVPGVVIGFNDSVAFGFTNGEIDVMDFYKIRFKDDSKAQYWYEGQWTNSKIRIEEIKVRGGKTLYDTVAYSVFGPVMYDKSFTNVSSGGNAIAIRWKAHDPSNELLMWWWLDRAKNYDDYAQAIRNYACPIQNMVFASKQNEIAIWQQGQVPLRWPRQGLYLMPGDDSRYAWQGVIPQNENPHIVNPQSGFVSSANQRATDSTYPYYVPGDYLFFRGYTINRFLSSMEKITPDDMKRLQNNNHNTRAEMVRPILMKHVDQAHLDEDEKRYVEMVAAWDLENDPGEAGASVFETWMDSLRYRIWHDELSRTKDAIYPDMATMIDLLRRDSTVPFVDDINTPKKETVTDVVTESLKAASVLLAKRESQNQLPWAKFKNTTIYHMLRTGALPFAEQGIMNGGGPEIINATSHSNGPSWRMIVHLTPATEAYGVYPGGQSGNPGSRFYNDFIETWAKGDYFKLWVMKKSEAVDKRVRWTMRFSTTE
jgi:penicillin amidase